MTDISNQQLLDALTDQLGTITDNMATKKDVKEIIREETADIRDEQLRQGVLLEDLDSDFKKLGEAVSKELKLKNQVDDHDKRVSVLESKSKIIIPTITHHSAQIKALRGGKVRKSHAR